MSAGLSSPAIRPSRSFKIAIRSLRKVALAGLAIFFFPGVSAFYLCCGVLDVVRNQRRTYSTINRYFAGNGVLTWLLSPFNLLMDLLCLPYWNKGIYRIADLPKGYQDEIQSIIDTAHGSDLVGKLESKMEGQRRGMIFFKWYGKNVPASIDVPEFHRDFKYVRTIGVSVFNKKQSTGKHFGPLRITLRVLYNINNMHRPKRLHQGRQSNQLLARQQTLHLRRHPAASVVQRIGRRALLHVRRHPPAQPVSEADERDSEASGC